MAERKPRADVVRIAGKKVAAQLADVVTDISLDYGVGQVAELSITAADPTGRLDNSPLAALGTTVTMTDDPAGSWEVGSIDAVYGAGITWTYRSRSKLAKNLRVTFKTGAETKVSPTEWVTRKVREAGGKTVAQPSSKRVAIGQGGKQDRQSVLDVIGNLASELEWGWVEHGNTFYFGDPYWALTGGPKLPTWPVTWKSNERSDALAMSVNLSDDDTETRGTLDLSLPNDFGRRLRPWHRVQLKDAGRYAGVWLVQSVSYRDDDYSVVDVSCGLPRKPAKKGGST
jgi:hypothetical protein